MNIYVAMSGGVDSSVAALLLVRKGYDVTGVFMKPWQPHGFPCMWEQDRSDALRIASALNIPFETWDFSDEYARHVSGPMVKAYRTGTTPNPDVECNRHIKFGLFYTRALKQGATHIATGHYARIRKSSDNFQLLTAKDSTKDQSYFLWGLSATQLPRVLFPVGNMLKSDVRHIAASEGLGTAEKKDSQGLCFVGPLDMKSYLKTVIAPRKGIIIHADGRELGEHDGAGYYTIGQRHGLDIRTGGGPYFVIKKEMRRNRIIVGPASMLQSRTASIKSAHWIGSRPLRGARLNAKIRYRTPTVPVRVTESRVRFLRPVSALTAGQSIVFYEGSRVAGGAILR